MAEIKFNADNAGMNEVRNVGFPVRILTGEITFSDDYPLGGEELDLSMFFAKYVAKVDIEAKNNRTFEYLYGSKKVLARVGNTGSEVAVDADLSDIGNEPEIQVIDFSDAASGSFKLQKGENQTAAIAHDDSSGDFETAINALDGISGASVSGENGEFVIEYDKSTGDSGVTVYDDDNSLEDGDSEDVIPELEIVNKAVKQGVKFIAWGY